MREMISPEEARELVLSKVQAGRVVTVDLLEKNGIPVYSEDELDSLPL